MLLREATSFDLRKLPQRVHNLRMTNAQAESDSRYEFDMADRMRRALRVSGVGVAEMADYLEVSRDTVGNWINGRARPRLRDARLFALKTGFSVTWLAKGLLPDLDSNQEPAGIKPERWLSVVERDRDHTAEIIELRPRKVAPCVAEPRLA